MAKKKPETPTEEIKTTELTEDCIQITPEQLMEIQGNGMQTVMSIGLAERLWLEDRQDRILYLDEDVDDHILHTLILQIAKINGEDLMTPVEERVPITLIVNSAGGNAFIGMALVNVIQNSKTPIIGVCLGMCASMAFGIFAVCHMRFAVPDAVFMVHDGSVAIADNITKVKDYINFLPKLEERYNKAIASRTKFTTKELSGTSPHDNWYFADELVEMDMVDGIIGKDVELDDIFAFMCDRPCECEACAE